MWTIILCERQVAVLATVACTGGSLSDSLSLFAACALISGVCAIRSAARGNWLCDAAGDPDNVSDMVSLL